MHTLWIESLETLVHTRVGRMNYQKIKGLVEKINNSVLLLNLLIEVAVNALRARHAG
jgi:hypothetical protein